MSKEIILTEMIRRESRLSIGPERRREAKYIDFSNYSHIINFEETKGFFRSLKELYVVILTYASSDVQAKRKSRISNLKDEESGLHDSRTTFSTHDKDSHDENPFGRASDTDTDRSLTENGLLRDSTFHNDTFDGSHGLSLSMTFEDSETMGSDEDREFRRRQKKEKKKKERQFKFAAIDDRRDPTDYDVINRFLLRVHSQLDRLDSGGRTLRHIFEQNSEKIQFEAFRVFIMNLEVYGSFFPLNEKLYDPQVTRIASYLKIGKLRKRIDEIVADFENCPGKILRDVVVKTKIVSYYFNKLEAFLSRKQQNSHHSPSGETMHFCIDYEANMNGLVEEEKSNENSDIESTDGEDNKFNTPRSEMSVVEDDEDEYYYTKTLFKDFSEPDMLKTGYLIPITCGHNG